MTDDKIAQALNMRPLEEVEAEKQEALERLNPKTKPDIINSFSHEPKEELVQESVDDVKNLPQESVVQPPAIISKEAEENLQDIELAKANIENIINLGDDSVKEMVEIAKQSESPRAFEVVSTLMKTLLDANKDYVEMSTKKRYAKEEDTSNQAQITNNNLIVSTADLLKMIKGDKEDG
ncbi:MAG: hypothetical protein CBD11_06875 [Phycisphaera sp. TMED151]|nr:MAG: hypothetical protein CBD11_06875 [Phycisphaera sp. TMED151]